MAERNVFWRISTNFARQRRDADRLAESLERVSRQTGELDDSTTSGNENVERSTRRRTRATENQTRRTRESSSATEDNTRSLRNAIAAEEAMVRAARAAGNAVEGLAESTDSATRASQRAVSQSLEEERAHQQVARATNSRERAALALERAQSRLSQTEARHGGASQQYANALVSVRTRTLELEGATQRYHTSLRGLDRAQAASNDRLERGARSAGGAARGFRNFANSVMNFPVGMMRGIASAMVVVVPIAALITSALGYLTTTLSVLSAGAIAVIGPLGSMAGALAAIPQAASVAAGAIATLVGAFSGIGDALKAGTEAQDENGKSARNLASQHKQAARAIVMARRALRNATESAEDSARQYNRALGEGVEAVTEAKEAEIDASRALSAARKQARADIDALKVSLRDLALSERGAAISVEEARRRLQNVLADPGASDMSKSQAQLAYDEALARMDDVKKEQEQAKKDSASANKKGVEGSDLVVQAKKEEADAVERLTEAQINFRDTQREASRASRDAAEAIADAQYNLADAIQRANEVGADGSSVQDKYRQSMEKLSPAGQKFVQTLMGLRGELKTLKFAAQEGLLPGLGDALVTLTKLTPLAADGLRRFGTIMGDTATKAADTLTSDKFMPMWGRLLSSNEQIMQDVSDGMLNLLEAVVYLMDAARPFTEWLSKTVLGWTEYWKEISKAGNETGATADALDRTKESLTVFGNTIKNVWKTFKGFARAGRKDGMGLLSGMEDITHEWEKWANSPKGQAELKEWFDSMKAPLSEFSGLLGDITRGIFDMGKDKDNSEALTNLVAAIRDMGPAVKELLENLQGDFGEKVVKFIDKLVQIFANLTEGGGGGLSTFVDILSGFASVLETLSGNSAGQRVLQGVAVALATIAALKFTGVLAGIRGLYRSVNKIRAWRNPAAAGAAVEGQAAAGARRATGNSSMVGSSGGARRATRGERRTARRNRTTPVAATEAASSPTVLAPAAPRRRTRMREGFQSRMASRNEGGFVSLGGGTTAPAQRQTRSAGRAAARPERRQQSSGGGGARRASGGGAAARPERRQQSSGGGARRASGGDGGRSAGRAAAGAGRFSKGAAGAGGAATGLALALSMLPGPIGEIASKFMVVSMVFSAIQPLIMGLGKIFVSVIGKIGGTLFKLVGVVAKAMGMISKVLMANPWMLLVAAIIIVVVLVVKYWDEIKAAISKAIKWLWNFVKKNWGVIKWIMGPLGLLIDLVVKNWDKIKRVFSKGMDAVISLVKKIWGGLKTVFSNPLDAAKSAMDTVWGKIKSAFSAAAGAVENTMKGLKKGISSVWGGIKKALGTPVEFVVNTVINDWLIGNVNSLLGKIGLDNLKIAEVPKVKFARGGQVPGQGNRDSIDAQLMPGEFVLRRDAVKAIGVNRLHAMNEGHSYRGANEQRAVAGATKARRNAKRPVAPERHIFGDIVGKAKDAGSAAFGGVKSAAKSTWGTVTDAGGKVIDLAREGASKSLELLLKPLRRTLNALGDTWVLDDAVKDMGNKLFDGAIGWIGGAQAAPEKEGLNRGGRASGVPALLTPGEFVFNTNAVSEIGLPNLRRMNRSGKSGARAMKFAKGGAVPSLAASVLKRKKKPQGEGVLGDSSIDVQKFATGGPVLGGISATAKKAAAALKKKKAADDAKRAAKTKFSDVQKYIQKGKVERAQVTATRKADKGQTIRGLLTEVHGWKPTAKTLAKFLGANGLNQKKTAGKKGGATPAMTRAQNFARAQHGKPYIWGGVGPKGYDCSGFTGSIYNVIKGQNPNRRLFATGNMASELPRLGFKSGLGGQYDYSLGWRTGNPGHTSGTLGTMNVESTGSHVRVGSAARSAANSLYTRRMHLPLGKTKDTPGKVTGKKKTLDSKLETGKKYKIPDVLKYLGGKTWGDVKKKFGFTDKGLHDLVKPHIGKIKALKGDKGKPFVKGYRNVHSRLVEAQKKKAGTTKTTASAKPKTPAELYLENVQGQAAREKSWTSALSQLSVWGFSDLVTDMMGKGIDTDGVLQSAIEVSKNKPLAKKLNDAVKAKGNLVTEDLEKVMKAISYLSTSKALPGLRDMARHLEMTDYETVRLMEQGMKTKHFDSVKPKMSRIQQDISTYRGGLFYANTGGQVPGVGSKDTVPAMLTPGEFVIKKAAAKALGLENLMALNGQPQKFAKGGEVLAPRISGIPTKAVGSVSSRALNKGAATVNSTEIIYDIDINNPIAEPGTRSMVKALQRQAMVPGSSVKKK